jgi:hypothetical protein
MFKGACHAHDMFDSQFFHQQPGDADSGLKPFRIRRRFREDFKKIDWTEVSMCTYLGGPVPGEVVG